jgi:hypothetical protein
VFAAIYFHSNPELPFWKTADLCGPAIALGQAIGRIGCLMAGDDFRGSIQILEISELRFNSSALNLSKLFIRLSCETHQRLVASSKNLNEMGIVASSKNLNETGIVASSKVQTNSFGGFYPLFERLTGVEMNRYAVRG